MRVGRSEARAVRERSMICSFFFSPLRERLIVFSPPIQDSIIYPRMMTRKRGLELGGRI